LCDIGVVIGVEERVEGEKRRREKERWRGEQSSGMTGFGGEGSTGFWPRSE
jgi:hypothetical protein